MWREWAHEEFFADTQKSAVPKGNVLRLKYGATNLTVDEVTADLKAAIFGRLQVAPTPHGTIALELGQGGGTAVPDDILPGAVSAQAEPSSGPVGVRLSSKASPPKHQSVVRFQRRLSPPGHPNLPRDPPRVVRLQRKLCPPPLRSQCGLAPLATSVSTS